MWVDARMPGYAPDAEAVAVVSEADTGLAAHLRHEDEAVASEAACEPVSLGVVPEAGPFAAAGSIQAVRYWMAGEPCHNRQGKAADEALGIQVRRDESSRSGDCCDGNQVQ